MKTTIRLLAATLALAGLAGCGDASADGTSTATPTTTTKAGLGAWAADNLTLVTDIGADLSSIGDAADPINLRGMSDACSTLAADIAKAQAADPMPDPAIDAHWQSALSSYATAAELCTEGTDRLDASKLEGATAALNAGTPELTKATELINAAN